MPRRSPPFTQADVTRAVRGVLAADVAVERITGVRVTKDGFTILLGETPAVQTEPANEWDEVLK